MAITYDPLLKTMKEKEISWYYIAQHGVDNQTIQQLRCNRNITMNTLEKLCNILNCTPNDIIKFTKDKKSL